MIRCKFNIQIKKSLNYLQILNSLQMEMENAEPVKKTIGKAFTHPYHSGDFLNYVFYFMN